MRKKWITGSSLLILIVILGVFLYYTPAQGKSVKKTLAFNKQEIDLSSSKITITKISSETAETMKVIEVTDSKSIQKLLDACVDHREEFTSMPSATNTWNNLIIKFNDNYTFGIITSNSQCMIYHTPSDPAGEKELIGIYKAPFALMEAIRDLEGLY
ncbi:MAG: hypothetical protein Q4F05_09830 [bacterium]|nr:hypothetical protein [bacterium]